jgi:SAM-dependent methyltransferase
MPPMLTEGQLTAGATEHYKAAHEQWFARMPDTAHLTNKPFSNLRECAEIFQQLGRLFAGLHLTPGMTVLDFGCGSCWLTEFLNKMGMHVVALDVSETALAIGRKILAMDRRLDSGLSIRYLAYDGRRIPLEDETVDRVVCVSSLHHVPNKIEILRELSRVMKPDSIFGLADAGLEHDNVPQSQFEVDTWGVLEDNLDLEELQRIGWQVGFRQLYLTLSPEPHFCFEFKGYDQVARQKEALFASAQEFSRNVEVFFFIKGNPLARTSATPDRLTAQLALSHELLELDGNRLTRPLLVEATNTGNTVWLADLQGQKGQVNLGMHLFTENSELADLDYFRMSLPCDVAPGDTVTLEITSLPARTPGNYWLEIDLVDEGFCWFKQWGSAAKRARLDIRAAGVAC